MHAIKTLTSNVATKKSKLQCSRSLAMRGQLPGLQSCWRASHVGSLDNYCHIAGVRISAHLPIALGQRTPLAEWHTDSSVRLNFCIASFWCGHSGWKLRKTFRNRGHRLELAKAQCLPLFQQMSTDVQLALTGRRKASNRAVFWPACRPQQKAEGFSFGFFVSVQAMRIAAQ